MTTICPVKTFGAAFDHGGRRWLITPWTKRNRIYANQFEIDTPASKMSSKKALDSMYLYCTRKGSVEVGGGGSISARQAFMVWFKGYVSAGPDPKFTAFSDQRWQDLVRHCNGAANGVAVKSMAAATVRRKTFSQLFGVRGTSYPPTDDMNDMLTHLDSDRWGGTRWGSITLEVPPVIQSGRNESEMPPPQPTPAPAVDATPAPAPAAESSDFDPNAMTYGQLVDLARKGAGADQRVEEASRLYASAMAERDEAIVARDEALKRASMVAPVDTKVVTGDGSIEVEGVTLPSFKGGHGPARIDGYDLSAWRARVEVGDFCVTASAPEVAASIMAGDSVRLVGPPSVGKTSGIREVCAITGAKFFLIPCGEGATDLSLIAERVIDSGGQFVWRDGFITQAVRWANDHPDTVCVCVLDEVDHLVPEVQSLLHSVLEGGTLCVNPEETLTVPANMRFVATANTSGLGDTTGHHASAKVSDTAFTSRWNATYTVAYLPAEAETRLLVNAGAPVEEAERAVRCAGMTRSDAASVTQPVVLRQLLAWARACGRGTDPKSAWAWRVMTSTPDHDRPALRELTRTCFDW